VPARILIIEDDAASLALAKYLLESAGYQIHVATNGVDGLRCALTAGADLVICDIEMPRMNGYEVAQHLIKDPLWSGPPIIAVTAFSMPGDREKALSAGFAGYLSKPITPETFVSQIESFLKPSGGQAPAKRP
jgi:CheY-like chemotaxis protein